VTHLMLDIPAQGITPQSAFLCRKARTWTSPCAPHAARGTLGPLAPSASSPAEVQPGGLPPLPQRGAPPVINRRARPSCAVPPGGRRRRLRTFPRRRRDRHPGAHVLRPGPSLFLTRARRGAAAGVTIDTVRPDLQVNLRVFVPNASLSFVKVPDGYLARFELSTRVVDPETGDLLRERKVREHAGGRVRADEALCAAPGHPFRSRAPGRYDLEIRGHGLDNRKQAARGTGWRWRSPAPAVVTRMNRFFFESRRPDGTWEPAYNRDRPAEARTAPAGGDRSSRSLADHGGRVSRCCACPSIPPRPSPRMRTRRRAAAR